MASTAVASSALSLPLKAGLVALVLSCVTVPLLAVLDLWPFHAARLPVREAAAVLPVAGEDKRVVPVPGETPAVVEPLRPHPVARAAAPTPASSTPDTGDLAEPTAGAAVVLPSPGPCSELGWTFASGSNVASARLRLLAAADPRAEWQDTPVQEFFQGLKAQAGMLDPAVDRVIPAQPDTLGKLRFEATNLPSGRYLVWLEARDQGEFVTHVRLDPGRQTDLGEIKLVGRPVTITVTDGASGRPIAGARVQTVHDVFPLGPARNTDAEGKFLWPGFSGTHVRVESPHHVPSVVRLNEPNHVAVSLDAAKHTAISAPPGTWVFVSVGRAMLFTTADKNGQAVLSLPAGGRPPLALFFDPGTEQWHGGLLQEGRLPTGPCSLRVEVKSGERALPAGSVSLTHRAGKMRILLVAGVKDGVAEFTNIPALSYAPEVRCGPQIHDNDHTYQLPELLLAPGNKPLRVELPGKKLAVQVLTDHGSPLAFQKVTYQIRGQDEPRRLTYRISCIGLTDAEGRVTFPALPPGQGQLRIRDRTFPLAPSGEVQIVRL